MSSHDSAERGQELTVIRELLITRFGAVGDVAPVGAGAWSRAYSFSHEGQQLVARIGRHLNDFEADRAAMAFDCAELPVPTMIMIEPITDGPAQLSGHHLAVSERSLGNFPEELTAEQWRRLVPAWAQMLTSLWAHDPQVWPADLRDRFGAQTVWSQRLLSVADDPPDPTDERNHGWTTKLAAAPGGTALFDRGYTELRRLTELDAVAQVSTRMIHGDLINRNVLVDVSMINSASVTAVFDWGCGFVGDPLYDLVWLDFWSPWHPGLSSVDLRTEFAELTTSLKMTDADLAARWRACAIHIGLAHLAYNAQIGAHEELAASGRRLMTYLS